ncbi:MAG: 3-deoxy-manno-octulosonate cytidylyltransferase [Proteobacteria bacterium]|nr:3-deoxy-manno-octulosonate cytidylyltransferase [Pseudomonadota bacterium]
MSAVGIVPARFASRRFPGKALTLIAGLPMLQRVWEGARTAKQLRELIVATDDARIAAACAEFGAPVVMTSPAHATGTDRVAEAARDLTDEIVVNVQGDEPLIEGFVIDAVVEALLQDPDAPMSTVAHAPEPGADADPNRVCVECDAHGFALSFSRAPAVSGAGAAARWQHAGLYAYRRSFLRRFTTLEPTDGERAEGLEQLRALEHGYPIRVAVVEGWASAPVDVPEDVARVEERIASRDRHGDRQVERNRR